MKRREVLKSLAMGGLIATGLSPRLAASADKPPIKIATSLALSGPIAAIAADEVVAMDLAVADVNASGGINGSPVELLKYDDSFKPEEAVLRLRDAYQAGAVGLLGPISSTQWETVLPLVNQLKFPAINANANALGITNQRPYALRLQPPDNLVMPEVMSAFFKHYPDVKNVVVMGDVKEDVGKSAIEIFSSLSKQAGREVLSVISFTTGQTDFSPIAIKLKSQKPDAILIGILIGDAVRFASAAAVQGVKVPFIGGGPIYPGPLPNILPKTIGDDAALWHVGGFCNNIESSGDPKIYQSFVDRYSANVLKISSQSQFKPPNVANITLAYDSLMLMAQLLREQKVDGTTPLPMARDKLKDGMVALKTWTNLNRYTFNANGDAYIPSRVLQIDPAKNEWVFIA